MLLNLNLIIMMVLMFRVTASLFMLISQIGGHVLTKSNSFKHFQIQTFQIIKSVNHTTNCFNSEATERNTLRRCLKYTVSLSEHINSYCKDMLQSNQLRDSLIHF